MSIFIRTVAGILVAVLLNICISKQAKDFSLLLTVLVCCCIAGAATHYLEQIIDFVRTVNHLANIDAEGIAIVFKAVGIGILGEIVCQICDDSGNASLGKTLKLLTSSVILWLSLPLFIALLELIEGILIAV